MLEKELVYPRPTKEDRYLELENQVLHELYNKGGWELVQKQFTSTIATAIHQETYWKPEITEAIAIATQTLVAGGITPSLNQRVLRLEDGWAGQRLIRSKLHYVYKILKG